MTYIKVERLNTEIPSQIIIEQWRSLIFAIDIHSKCNQFPGTYASTNALSKISLLC